MAASVVEHLSLIWSLQGGAIAVDADPIEVRAQIGGDLLLQILNPLGLIEILCSSAIDGSVASFYVRGYELVVLTSKSAGSSRRVYSHLAASWTCFEYSDLMFRVLCIEKSVEWREWRQ